MGLRKGHPKYGGIKKGSKHKKTISQELALEDLRKRIREDWDEFYQAKKELAKGIWIEKVDRITGKFYVYRKEPDSQSLEYLFSMVAGKPKESLNVSGGITTTEVDSKDLKEFINWRKSQK